MGGGRSRGKGAGPFLAPTRPLSSVRLRMAYSGNQRRHWRCGTVHLSANDEEAAAGGRKKVGAVSPPFSAKEMSAAKTPSGRYAGASQGYRPGRVTAAAPGRAVPGSVVAAVNPFSHLEGTMRRLAFLAAVACLWGCALPGTGRAGLITYTVSGNFGYDSGVSMGPDTLGLGGATFTFVETIDSSATPASTQTSTTGTSSGYTDASATITVSGASVASTDGTFQESNGTGMFFFHGVGSNLDGYSPGSHINLPGATGAEFDLSINLPQGTVPFSGGVAGLPVFPEASYGGDLVFIVGDATYDVANIQASGVLSGLATPEPASLTLSGIGAAGLLSHGWRRRKRAMA